MNSITHFTFSVRASVCAAGDHYLYLTVFRLKLPSTYQECIGIIEEGGSRAQYDVEDLLGTILHNELSAPPPPF